MKTGVEISSPSECHHCHRLKKAIKDAKSMREHCEAADAFLRHLAGQWSGRAVYWQGRSRAKTSRDILRMIADGMDKSKYLLPRWTGGRAPKPVESYFDEIILRYLRNPSYQPKATRTSNKGLLRGYEPTVQPKATHTSNPGLLRGYEPTVRNCWLTTS